jgi:hypothetical protein
MLHKVHAPFLEEPWLHNWWVSTWLVCFDVVSCSNFFLSLDVPRDEETLSFRFSRGALLFFLLKRFFARWDAVIVGWTEAIPETIQNGVKFLH